MAKKNALLIVGEKAAGMLRPEKMEALASMVHLTTRAEFAGDEGAYADALREADAEIVITGWGSPKLTVGVLEKNPQLKYMCQLTGTLTGLLEREAIEKGLLVTNWGDLIGPTVAEGALMGMLSCLRRTTHTAFLMHLDKGWQDQQAVDVESLFYQKVGLHGFGTIARSLVRLLEPFGCAISAYSPHVPDEIFKQTDVRRVKQLKTLYSENRIISIHASKTPENHHIVNADILAAMPDGGILVNTARGAVIDTDALVRELKTGRVFASLDVYDPEPPPADSPLRGLRNCQLTCHTAGPTPDRLVDFGDAAVENIRKYISGETVLRIVDVQKFDLIT